MLAPNADVPVGSGFCGNSCVMVSIRSASITQAALRPLGAKAARLQEIASHLLKREY